MNIGSTRLCFSWMSLQAIDTTVFHFNLYVVADNKLLEPVLYRFLVTLQPFDVGFHSFNCLFHRWRLLPRPMWYLTVKLNELKSGMNTWLFNKFRQMGRTWRLQALSYHTSDKTSWNEIYQIYRSHAPESAILDCRLPVAISPDFLFLFAATFICLQLSPVGHRK